MIFIYSKQTSPRLKYVLDFCFSYKGLEWRMVTSMGKWEDIYDASRINYSREEMDCDVHIDPHGLLFETGVNPEVSLEADQEALLTINEKEDPLALVFYLLSRMEEYNDTDRDDHDRLKSENHSLVKLGLHKRPMVDELVKKLWDDLGLNYKPVLDRFEAVPSFDIDVAWAYKNKKLIRTVGGYLRSDNKKARRLVLRNKQADPFDTYSIIYEVAAKVDRVICFALLGDLSKYDKNIHWKNQKLASVIRGLNAGGGMGIHPSYKSHLNPSKLAEEKRRLEKIVGHSINKSRQHYLRLKMPETYKMLLATGITRDYSMGFADNIGFRAGTSFPFQWFDLDANQQTDLLVFPFAYMDGALKDYLGLKPLEARLEVEELIENVEDVGGVFMFVWHNSSINNHAEWKGWRKLLDYTMDKVLE
ncbi:polysaccharide deacetylase family protein [Crocinitomix catalasitica]|nr:polysaccharide deacetylase family protein [Crocinitomix catalasitica]